MVAGKMRVAMGLKKASPKPQSPPSPSPPKTTTVFSRSFGVYFPRSSSQVQPDSAELLRLIEDLRERESRLRTELLQHKLLRQSLSIVPALEADLQKALDRNSALETENQRLRSEVEDEKRKVVAMEAEIAELKKTAGLVEASGKSNLIKNLRRGGGARCSEISATHKIDIDSSSKQEEVLMVMVTAMEDQDLNIRSGAPRVPKPPPRPASSTEKTAVTSSVPVPPPPPPPAKGPRAVTAAVRRVPEVAELYHSLMRRDSAAGGVAGATPPASATNARDMIGEIENRSAHLLAIKTDVETQGDFIRFLIKEVETAGFANIDDVVPFVKWLDDELSYLVDERAVLKHFDWPEQKADALREAAFGYSDLKKIVTEASSFRIDARQPCSPALKKMQGLLEKLEHGVYNLSRMRESAIKRYRNFQIPTDWMQEAGIASQIKLASVKLAMKYMKRVSAELETIGGGSEEEELIVQGVRFAFRVHQFAGGFDAETMRAFQELRDKAGSCRVQWQSHQTQKLICRPTPC